MIDKAAARCVDPRYKEFAKVLLPDYKDETRNCRRPFLSLTPDAKRSRTFMFDGAEVVITDSDSDTDDKVTPGAGSKETPKGSKGGF